MYLKLDESKWYKHTYEWSDRSKGIGRVDVYKGQIEVAEDVAPVVHAHWEITKLTAKWIFVCSHCRCGWYESYEGEDIAWKYCPDCGALMDEEAG